MDAAEATVLSTQEGKEKNISPVKEALELGGLLFLCLHGLALAKKYAKIGIRRKIRHMPQAWNYQRIRVFFTYF